MKLTDNKEYIIQEETFDYIKLPIRKLYRSNFLIHSVENIWIDELITSEYLLRNIYDEINR